MAGIVVAEEIPENIVEGLRKFGSVADRPEGLSGEISDARILIVRSKTKVGSGLLEGAKNLRLVVRAGVGVDNIDLEECRKRHIEVVNTPRASTVSVAEITMGLMLTLQRNIARGDALIRRGLWEKGRLKGNELYGKTLGIIGLGRIGKALAERGKAFGMKILAYDPYVSEGGLAVMAGLDEVLKNSDIVSIHTSLTDDTRKMINQKTISRMKSGAVLINVARGEIVDEDALYDALKSGKLKGAALDVFSREPYEGKLTELDNVVLTPHLGGSTFEALDRIGHEVLEIVEKRKAVLE